MKNVVLIILVYLLCGCSMASMVTAPPTESIIEVNGTKPELYERANEWMVKIFNNAKSIIQFQDKEEGTIIEKYLMHSYPIPKGNFDNFTSSYSLTMI